MRTNIAWKCMRRMSRRSLRGECAYRIAVMHSIYSLCRILALSRNDITIVPILVGAISSAKEDHFGRLLAPYLSDAANFFVVSSDFCHWCASRSTSPPYPTPTPS